MIIESMESKKELITIENKSDSTIFGRAAAVCCQLRANRMKRSTGRTLNVSRGVREGREVVMAREYYC